MGIPYRGHRTSTLMKRQLRSDLMEGRLPPNPVLPIGEPVLVLLREHGPRRVYGGGKRA